MVFCTKQRTCQTFLKKRFASKIATDGASKFYRKDVWVPKETTVEIGGVIFVDHFLQPDGDGWKKKNALKENKNAPLIASKKLRAPTAIEFLENMRGV